jgi:RNA polymerase-binding transcription factor DksA
MSSSAVRSEIDSTELSAEGRLKLRSLLLRELAEREAQVTDCRATTSELTGQGDVDSLLEREIALASAASANEALDDVRHALERLEAGTYGVCEGCGRTIPFERLEAIPQARLCVACPPWVIRTAPSGARL